MRRRFLTLALLTLFATTAQATVAMAAPPAPEGDRINILTIYFVDGGVSTFDADAPFWVKHGSCISAESGANPAHAYFRLSIDGVSQGHGRRVREPLPPDDGDPDTCDRMIMWNQYQDRDGLPAGVHTFTGFWHFADGTEETFTVTITFS